MKKKIIFISIFTVLLMLSMPIISNIQAKQLTKTAIKENRECNICSKIKNPLSTTDPPGICFTLGLIAIRFYQIAYETNNYFWYSMADNIVATMERIGCV